MRCSLCGGKLQKERITYSEVRNSKVFLFESTPVLVCRSCGDLSFTAGVMEAMDRVIREERKPEKIEKVPVYSLSGISAADDGEE